MSNGSKTSTTKQATGSPKLVTQSTASVDGSKLELTAPAPAKPTLRNPNALSVSKEEPHPEFLALGYERHDWQVLTKMIYPQATNYISIVTAAQYCKARRLDPLQKYLHIVPLRDGDQIWPGVALYRVQAHRTGEYVGLSKPDWGPMVDVKGVQMPEYCGITVYRYNKLLGKEVGYYAEVYAAEQCVIDKATGKPNTMWAEAPRQQLKKGAESLALREAFPEENGGMETFEEMEGRDVQIVDNLQALDNFQPPPPPPTVEEKNQQLIGLLGKKAEEEKKPQSQPEPAESAESAQPSSADTVTDVTPINDATATSTDTAPTAPEAKQDPPKPSRKDGNQSATTAPKEPASAANTVADTSATRSEESTASPNVPAITGRGATAADVSTTQDTGTSASARNAEPVDEDQLEQLVKAGGSNGWEPHELVFEIKRAFQLESPMEMNQKQWARLIDHVLANKPGTELK